MILIHVAGNENIGIGNIIRCKALGEEIVKSINQKLYFVCETNILYGKEIQIEGAVNYFVSTNDEALSVIDNIMGGHKIDAKKKIIITDILDLKYEANLLYRSMGADYIIQINDCNVNEFSPDAFINGDGFKQNYNFDKDIKILSGPEYHIIRKDIKESRASRPWNRDLVNRVMIVFGGADPAYYTELLVKYLYHSKEFTDIEFSIILGPGFSSDRRANMTKFKNHNIKFLRTPNIKEQILYNDVIITLGGITSYEAMYLGKPVGAIGWEYMNYYVEGLDREKLIKNLGKGEESLLNFKEFFRDISLLKSLAYNGWKTIDGLGANRICNFIKKEVIGSDD